MDTQKHSLTFFIIFFDLDYFFIRYESYIKLACIRWILFTSEYEYLCIDRDQ